MPPLSTTEFAPAKVNLTLHVTGQRSDGYHLLDSLVVFCDIGDQITLCTASSPSLSVTGPFAQDVPAGAGNLVLRALQTLAPDLPLAITLVKNLPVASGLGGGSADAAAAIRAVLRHRQDLHPAPLPLDTDALMALGADVPVCLQSAPMRMRGIGEDLTPAGPLPATFVVLVNPREAVSTPDVFRGLAVRCNPAMSADLPTFPDAAALASWLAGTRNDLELPARAIAPVIGDVLALLSAESGALFVRMSGSGATCFALFASRADAQGAAASIARQRPHWWAAAGRLLEAPPHNGQLIRETT